MSCDLRTFFEKLPPDTIHRLTVQLVLSNKMAAPPDTDDGSLVDVLSSGFATIREVLPYLDAADLREWSASPHTACFDPSLMLHILTLPESAFRHKGWSDLETDIDANDAEPSSTPAPLVLEPYVPPAFGFPYMRAALSIAAALVLITPVAFVTLNKAGANDHPADAMVRQSVAMTAPAPASNPIPAPTAPAVAKAPVPTLTYADWEAEVTTHIKLASIKNNITVTGSSGTAIVKFVVDANGHMIDVRLAQPSGNPMLDHKALMAVGQAAPVSPPLYPNLSLTVPFQYRG